MAVRLTMRRLRSFIREAWPDESWYEDPDADLDAQAMNARVEEDYGSLWKDIRAGDVISFSPIVSIGSAFAAALDDFPQVVSGEVEGVKNGIVGFKKPIVLPQYDVKWSDFGKGKHSRSDRYFHVPGEWYGTAEPTEYLADRRRSVLDDVRSVKRNEAEGYYDYEESPNVDAMLSSHKRAIARIDRAMNDEVLLADVQDRIDSFRFIEFVSRGARREKLADVKGLKKADLITYVIAVLGQLGKDDILRIVARLEDKPYMRNSNGSYFTGQNPGPYGKPGIVDDVIAKAGKGPRGAILYDLTDKGRSMAQRALARLGEEPARVADAETR